MKSPELRTKEYKRIMDSRLNSLDLYSPDTKYDHNPSRTDLSLFDLNQSDEAEPVMENFSNTIENSKEKKFQSLLRLIEHGNLNELKEALVSMDAKANCFSKYFSCTKSQKKTEISATRLNSQDEYQMTIMHWAVIHGKYDIVHYLLKSGALPNIPNANGYTAFHKAILNNKYDIVRLFISSGMVDVNEKNKKKNMSPLYLATLYHSLEMVQILIKHKCDLDDTNDVGLSTALHLASKRGYLDIVECLLVAGADIDKLNMTNGNTAVIKCSIKNYKRILLLLIEKGANLNIQNHKGNTALHEAVENGNLEIIKVLLLHHARTDLKNHAGKTVYQLLESPGIEGIHSESSRGSEILKLLTYARKISASRVG